MNNTTMIIIGVLIVLGIGAFVALNYYKKKNITQLFEQVYMTSRQVPKQKKNSFLLMMFKETLSASFNKKKTETSVAKLNNPKYLEIQMMQMSKILKDSSNVQDKATKRALIMLKQYHVWEAEKRAKAKEASQNKAA